MDTLSSAANDVRDVFVSHRSADDEWAKRLATRLELSSCTVWIDDLDISPGQSIPGAINHGLSICRFVVLIMTPAYFEENSDWTSAEWHAAIFDDPDGRRSRVIPLHLKNCPSIPPLLKHLKWIDFRNEANFRNAFDDLLRVVQKQNYHAPSRVAGQQITPGNRISNETLFAERASVDGKPDVIEEQLGSNLLPALEVPTVVWRAPISKKLARQVKGRDMLPRKRELAGVMRAWQTKVHVKKPFTPVFVRHADDILTLYDLEQQRFPFTPIIEKTGYMQLKVQDLLQDPDMKRIVIRMLMMCVSRHCYALGLVEARDDRYVFPSLDGGDVTRSWKLVRDADRTVTKKYTAEDQSLSFYYHEAVHVSPLILDDRFYLRIKPTVSFSDDGTNSSLWRGPRVGPMAMNWLGKQQNIDVFRDIRFWIYQLARGQSAIRMYAGDQTLKFDTRPINVRIQLGIAGDQFGGDELIDRLPILPSERELDFSSHFYNEDDEYD